MPTSLNQAFLTDPSSAIAYDESWEEEFRGHDEETTKNYVLVFNRQSESVRLEPERLDTAINESIERSRHILSLQENWDDEGSQGYEESTWTRATDLVRDLALRYWEANKIWVAPPRIMPGPEGSIDIHWTASNRELLVNIPSDDESPAGYFGSGGAKDSVKGKLDTVSTNHWILMWLIR